MITEYNRPKTLAEALTLLGRSEPVTIPLGGGTHLSHSMQDVVAVVDLQALELDKYQTSGKNMLLGAAVTLQALLEIPGIQPALYKAIKHEATYNLRQSATLAGCLVAAGGRSPLATTCLAMDAGLIIQPGDEQISYGDFLPFKVNRLHGKLITQISLPMQAHLVYEYTARTRSDQPIVCIAAAQWPSGRTRIALGGYGTAPVLVMDGPEPGGADVAARAAYSHASDLWASADYRSEVAGILTRRCIEDLGSEK